MIELIANENSTIDVINGEFPIGQRNTIKIRLEDKLLNKKDINFTGTGTCDVKFNLLSYGNFDTTSAISNLILNLSEDTTVTVENTDICKNDIINKSNCLHCYTSNSIKDGYGKIELPLNNASNNFVNNSEYILSFYAIGKNSKVTVKDSANITYTSIQVDDSMWTWQQYKVKFMISSNSRIPSIFIESMNKDSESEIFIDSIYMFESQYENLEPKDNKLESKIIITNPLPIRTLCRVLSYTKFVYNDEGDYYIDVLMAMPDNIVNLDIYNNIRCQFGIMEKLPEKITTLGNSFYTDDRSYIYLSEAFTLNGYLVSPLDFDAQIDLVVDKI